MTESVKLFTPREANQTLPLVRKIVADILEAGKEIRRLAVELGPDSENKPEIIKLMDQMEEHFDELENIGCSYKDWNFEIGLVDFPAVINGEEVSLCWRSDEAELKFYHAADEGFSGRKPIPQGLFV